MAIEGPLTSMPSSVGRTKRLIKGIGGGLAGRSVSLLAPFLVMPAMLRHLGDADFGVWMTAVALTSMALFADLGIGNGLLTRLSKAFGSNDFNKIRSDISSAYAVLASVAALLAIIGVGIWFTVKLGFGSRFLQIDSEATAIVAAAIGTFLLGIPANVIQRVFYASERALEANCWQIAGAALAVLVTFGCIASNASPSLVVFCYGLANPLVMVVAAIVFFHRHPNITPRLQNIDLPAIRDLVGLGSRFLLLSILTSIALNADNVIIAARLGDEAVTTYAIPAKIGSLLGLVITAISLPMWGAIGQALTQGDKAWVKAKTWRLAVLGAAGVAVAASILVVSAGPIMHFWIGRQFPDQYQILVALGLLSAAMAFSSPFHMVLNASSEIKPQIFAWALFSVSTLPTKYILLQVDFIYVIPLISFAGYIAFVFPVSYFIARRYWL